MDNPRTDKPKTRQLRMGPTRQGLHLMWSQLGRRKSRPTSILLAVCWGTFSMMLLLSFGEGLKRAMGQGRDGLSQASPAILWPGATTKAWQGLKAGRPVRFEEQDLVALRQSVPELVELAAERSRRAIDLRWGAKSVSAHVKGALPCFERIRSHAPQRGGRFFNDLDQAEARRVIFLGPALQGRLFGDAPAVGQTVHLRGVPFTVVGTMVDKTQNNMYGGPDVETATIPLSTFEALFGEEPYHNILYTVVPGADRAEVEKSVRQVIARRQHFDPEDESAIHVWDTGRGRREEDAFMQGFQIFLGVVGAMTLLVAGVGLANMLFVMVFRRTREIGMQMAIGAQRRVVMAQVVGESLMLAALGGYLGIGISWLVIEAVQRLPLKGEVFEFLGRPILSPPLAAVTILALMGVGCFAGLLPARRAARLNPVEALRHD